MIENTNDYQIAPTRHNGNGGDWILVNSSGDVEIRDNKGNTTSVTYEEMKQRVEELQGIKNKEFSADMKSILTFADMRRLETKEQL